MPEEDLEATQPLLLGPEGSAVSLAPLNVLGSLLDSAALSEGVAGFCTPDGVCAPGEESAPNQ